MTPSYRASAPASAGRRRRTSAQASPRVGSLTTPDSTRGPRGRLAAGALPRENPSRLNGHQHHVAEDEPADEHENRCEGADGAGAGRDEIEDERNDEPDPDQASPEQRGVVAAGERP